MAASTLTEEWRTRQEAARRRVSALFGLDLMVEGYRRVWREVVDSQPAART
jgi:hypothetical protein